MRNHGLSISRKSKKIRDFVAETKLDVKDFIMPYFITEGSKIIDPVRSMPGIYRLSIDELMKDITGLKDISKILLFGVTDKKDGSANYAYSKNGVVQKAISTIKNEHKDIIVFADVCLCGYTDHGHCNIITNGEVDSTQTLHALTKIAVSYAEAGADFVAPSAMADFQVRSIKEGLNDSGFSKTGILSYSAKFASSFYWPFRDALDSSPRFGDRKTYQMDYRNQDEPILAIKTDIEEGADIVMVKPALSYLDVIYRAKKEFDVPVAAYNVSGEYAIVKAVAKEDKIFEKEIALEMLYSIKRAGADFIISYFAKDISKWLT